MKFTDFLNENSTGAFKVIDKILIDIDDDEMHVDIDFKQVVKQFEAEYVLQNLVSNVDINKSKFKSKTITYTVTRLTKTDVAMLIHELDKHNLKYKINGGRHYLDDETV